ncbi:sugar O-acetyltransferase [Algoriphagus aquimarinus]|uniref:Acetyltransferase n=1 Tax=Algoriphagus aquimarinus TaxID=237018 RepID=A0A1I0VY20_9BACT|nr:sugar O-acetyltransferase [Algoriphagus aquimarinus]SFA81252.1 maltose O-acetyltransferase [Algoriphagus aquimarinus]
MLHKTEKQKMLSGELYNSRDPELLEQYHTAKALLLRYNTLDSRELIERDKILEELLAKKGEGVWIEAPFFCDYGENIEIGDNTFINSNCIFLDDNLIKIGENGLIAPMVQIYTATHPIKASDRIYQQGDHTRYHTFSKPVIIGDNVWIGGNVVIFPGVKIGDNVTIGAGSIVTKDLPNDVLAFGNPCQVVQNL